MKVREKLILYTHPNCDYSPMKKDELNDDGIDYDRAAVSNGLFITKPAKKLRLVKGRLCYRCYCL